MNDETLPVNRIGEMKSLPKVLSSSLDRIINMIQINDIWIKSKLERIPDPENHQPIVIL